MWIRIRERKLDGLRWGRRLAPPDRGIEVEQGGDDFSAIVERCRPDEPGLKLHVDLTEQPPLTLQCADERRHIAIVGRAADLLHDKRRPRSGGCRRVRDSRVDKVLDEGEAAQA